MIKPIPIIFAINMLLSITGVYVLMETLGFSEDLALAAIVSFLGIFLLLWSLSYLYSKVYFMRVFYVFSLFIFFIKEFIKANLKLTYDILTVKFYLEPAVIAIPLDIQSDFGIMLLANLITLTPGTLSLEVSDDKQYLYVHTLYLEGGKQQFVSNIKNGFEKRVIAAIQ